MHVQARYSPFGFAHKVAQVDIPLLSKEGRRVSAGVVIKVAKLPSRILEDQKLDANESSFEIVKMHMLAV
jgi:hypothetical protein